MASRSRQPGSQDKPLPGMDSGDGLVPPGQANVSLSGVELSVRPVDPSGGSQPEADIAREADHEANERAYGLRPTHRLTHEQHDRNSRGAQAVIKALHESEPIAPAPEVKKRTTGRVSLSTALQPSFIGIDPADYSDITPELIELASPSNLRSSLLLPRRGRYSASYVRGDTQRVEHVALTPATFGIIVSDVGSYAGRVSARTSVKRPVGNTHDAAAERSGAHAVQEKLERLQRYRENGIDPRRELINRFREAARYPGLSRFSSRDDFLAQLTYLQTAVVDDMITVIRHQRRWSNPDASERLLCRTIKAAMFVDRKNNTHIGYFREMMDLAADYYGSQWALVRDREQQASRYLKKHQTING